MRWRPTRPEPDLPYRLDHSPIGAVREGRATERRSSGWRGPRARLHSRLSGRPIARDRSREGAMGLKSLAAGVVNGVDPLRRAVSKKVINDYAYKTPPRPRAVSMA